MITLAQRIVLCDKASNGFKDITSGVPQGSTPYFFCLPYALVANWVTYDKMIKYVDDVAIAIPYKSVQSAEHLLQKELDNIEDWCWNRGLQLNKTKTKTKVMFVDKIEVSRKA